MRKILPCILAVFLFLTACSKPFYTDSPMEKFVFSHAGMSSGEIYTLSVKKTETNWQADIELYCREKIYSFSVLPQEVQRLNELINDYQLFLWAGFQKADKRVLDGRSFDLHITFADGKRLNASGSNVFPKGYAQAEEAIQCYFADLLNENGIANPF